MCIRILQNTGKSARHALMRMILLDIGLTLLGGPLLSPTKFISSVFSLPTESKSVLADVVFCNDYPGPDALLARLTEEFSLNVSAQQRDKLYQYWHDQVRVCTPLEGAPQFCKAIIERGYPYCIASNLWNPFYEAFVRHLPDVAKHAQNMFLSYTIGSRKPTARFYEYIFSAIGMSPEHTIMIGDSLDNDIIPCLNAGTTCIMLAKADTDIAYIEQQLSIYPTGQFHIATAHAECLHILDTLF